ncbi:MAG: ABC-type multidrug transport system ATPase subunit [Planctomycetota bacterium]
MSAASSTQGAPGLLLQGLAVQVTGRPLIEGADLRLPGDGITVIVGGSGAGKSLLLRILAGLLPQQGGPVTWQGRFCREDGTKLGRVGIVFQQFALFDEQSPIGNVQFALDHRGDRKAPAKSAEAWLAELRVPTDVHVANLSGGQKQRLALARTLAADPDILLYDEPTSGLDAASARQVAELIKSTQSAHSRPSLVVTHDYGNLLPIADHVLLLDAATKRLVEIPRDQWSQVPERMQPVAQTAHKLQRPSLPALATRSFGDFLAASGRAFGTALRLPLDLLPRWPRVIWGLRFTAHYLRLVAGPSAFLYLLLAGMIAGFTATYFTFRFLPQELYTKPLLLEDLLAAIGFALFRVLTPLLAGILIAARCGAAVAADVGVKRYGSQIEALRTLGVRPGAYLGTPILFAFVIGSPLLEWASYQAARVTSLVAFATTHPDQGPHYWQVHFTKRLHEAGQLLPRGTEWVLLKAVLGALGVGAIAYAQGRSPKESASDVSDGITRTVLWATLWVLIVHFAVAFLEF